MDKYKQFFISNTAIRKNGRNRKRYCAKLCSQCRAVVLACLCVFTLFPLNGICAPSQPALDIDAEAVVVLDAVTGTVVYEKNAEKEISSSGVFKTMSLLLFMEAVDRGELTMDTTVSISTNAAKQKGMSAFLEANGQYTVETLLKSVAMISANDACMALAEKITGSEETFVQKMNEKAETLGLTNTVFTNCTGLLDATQHTTAKDIAVISRELVAYSQLLKYSKIYMDTLKHSGSRVSELTNPNRLVRFYPGCDGLQTGSNLDAKYCMAATAQRDNQRFIAVVMGSTNSTNRSEAAKKLLDYGFANYTSVLLIRANENINKTVKIKDGVQSKVAVAAKDQVALLMEKGTEKGISKEIELEEELAAPVEIGQKVGVVRFIKDGEVLAQTDIVSVAAVEKAYLMDYFLKIIRLWF